MKKLINTIHRLRSKFWNEKRNIAWLSHKYKYNTYLGLLRGHWHCLTGKVIYENAYRPLILGPNIDFDFWSNSAIVLAGENDPKSIRDPANNVFPSATSIGMFPNFNHLNTSMGHPTRLRIKNNSRLVLEPNVLISRGCSFAISNNRELYIGKETRIGNGVTINTWLGMRIGKNVMIAFGTTIMDYDGHPIFQTKEDEEQERDTYGGAAKPITIEDNVWIGFKSTILKGVTIGAGSIVGAYACVTKDVPPNCMVAGNPAKIIKENISWRRY